MAPRRSSQECCWLGSACGSGAVCIVIVFFLYTAVLLIICAIYFRALRIAVMQQRRRRRHSLPTRGADSQVCAENSTILSLWLPRKLWKSTENIMLRFLSALGGWWFQVFTSLSAREVRVYAICTGKHIKSTLLVR